MNSVIKLYFPFFIGLISGLCFFNFTITYPGFDHLPGDLADGRFCNYLLEHDYLFFRGRLLESYWNAAFLFPEKNVISYSDNLLGSAPFYALFRLIGANRDLSFQLWFILISILNYFGCYVLLNYLFKNSYASALGAMIFTFSIALHSQIVHAQTFPRFPVPLALLFGLMYLKELKPLYFFLALFFLAWQFYCGIYLGFMLFVPLSLLLLFSMISKWSLYCVRLKQVKWYLFMIASLAACLLILRPLIIPYLERAGQQEIYSYDKVLQSLPTLRSFFFSHYGSLFWDFFKNIGIKYANYWDHEIFAGGIAIVCFITYLLVFLLKFFGLKKFPSVTITSTEMTLCFTAIFTFLLFIRVQGHSLYQLLYPLPGFASMRALQRIINIELVFFSVSVAFVSSQIFKEKRKWNTLVFLLFVLLIFMDNHISNDSTDRVRKSESEIRISQLKEKVKHLPKNSIISYEPDTIIGPVVFYQIDAMIVAQDFGLKTLNGYTANSPNEYSFYWEKPNEKNRLRWLKQMGFDSKKVVIIH